MRIYKILRQDEWDALQARGETQGAPIDAVDGFIHFSTAEQVRETVNKHFANVDGLLLAALETDALGDALKWEPSRGGALFPHLYGPLRLQDIVWVQPLPLTREGHVFPSDIGA